MIRSLDELEALYDAPKASSIEKVADRIEGAYADWIEASRFVILSTVGPEGTDASPRGDVGPVARRLDARRLAIPDWKGNNRIDSLRNIIRDPRVSLMFMVPGSKNVVRVNGRATLTAEDAVIRSFEVNGQHPVCVILVEVGEVYSQCPKAILRSELWTADPPPVPSAGQMLADASAGRHGGADYDRDYETRVKDTMW